VARPLLRAEFARQDLVHFAAVTIAAVVEWLVALIAATTSLAMKLKMNSVRAENVSF